MYCSDWLNAEPADDGLYWMNAAVCRRLPARR